MTEYRTRTRMKVLAALVLFMFGAITTRLWFLQVLASDEFSELADQNQVRLVPIEPIRGQIVDRKGRVLVGNRPSTVVLVDRREMAGQEDEVLFRLSNLLDRPVQDIVERLESVRYLPFEPIPVAEDVPEEAIFYIGEHPHMFPGVTFSVTPVRQYPQGSLAAHLLGYVGEISAEQLAEPEFEDYGQGDVVGKAGVESVYEAFLRGNPGTRGVRVNAQGRVLDDNFRSQSPVPGATLVLSIDAKAQELAERSLALGIKLARQVQDRESGRALSADGGAVVVMDPRNGQVLALASNPTYDPSIFLGGLTTKEFAPLNDPENHQPLLNRAIQSGYPPGSTFKPFVAGAALRQGFVKMDGFYPCPPTYIIPGDTQQRVWRNWTSHNYGHITLAESLVVSCDTVYYPMGSKFWAEYYRSDRQNEIFQRRMREMGFGARTGIDLPSEFAGIVPGGEYKKQLYESNPSAYCVGSCADESPWYPGDYVNMSIGQGFIQSTPLQLAVGFSAIANGGTLWEPHVGLRAETPEGKVLRKIEPVARGNLPFSKKVTNFLRGSMRGVAERGTAASAFLGFPLDEIPVSGKTGTAEIIPRQPYSWFAAMAPADDPKYVVVVMVEQGGHGSTTAAPVVRRILEGLFGLPTDDQLTAGSVQD